MRNRPNLPSWKVMAATIAAAVATGVGQAVARSGLDTETIVVSVSGSIATFLIAYLIPEGNPPKSALDRAG